MTVAQGPLQQDERLISLDVMRGVALFGILLMNITSFGMPFAYATPHIYGGSTGADLWSWIATSMLFEGTQRGLFSILFGAGVLLLTERIDARGGDSSQVFFRRNLWLIVFGIVHGYLLLWTGEILFFYGATAPFAYAFRKTTPRSLVAFALGGLLVGAAWNGLDAYNAIKKHTSYQDALTAQKAGATLTREQTKALKAWPEMVDDMNPNADRIRDRLESMRGSYTKVVAFQAPMVAHSESWYQYRYFFDVWSLMLIGMALYKLGLLHLGHPRSIYVWMVILGYGIGLTVNFFELRHLLTYAFHPLARLQADVTYDVGRLPLIAGHVGALMLFCNAGIIGWLQRALAAVGQMALTNYVSHSIICLLVFRSFGFGLYGHLSRHQLYYVVFAIWAFQLVISPLWLAYYRFGPLEWVWRSLTYGERQPMRRVAPAGEDAPLIAPAG